ncbi:protein inscuteable homolog isoform X1 [Photinus pyralis]|uniref:protein inscuteable homolog isoform X1 n=1 Tax=Photinus pyralis TaxID=7054 RepID=UPI0012677064|nr:protein inscuteable homolog isoform X1 [Photinus pyralis]
MGEFQRSPSKVWWQDDYDSWPRMSSPGSQDSGFSDAENLPPHADYQKQSPNANLQNFPKEILKNISEEDLKSQNLFSNIKQKFSPKKNLKHLSVSNLRTPPRDFKEPTRTVQSEPVKKQRFYRNGSLKVSRSLFKNTLKDDTSVRYPYQYAEGINDDVELQHSNTTSKVTFDDSHIWKSNENSVESFEGVKTYPFLNDSLLFLIQRNKSAPAILPPTDDDCKNISLSSHDSLQSSDSEFESAFHSLLNCPTNTSTPKVSNRSFRNMRQLRNKRISKMAVLQTNKSLFRLTPEAPPVRKWLQETKYLYETECTATLQCKSIAAELNQKVALLATSLTSRLRKVLSDSETILSEFNNIKTQKHHTGALAQSVARLVEEFVANFNSTCDPSDVLDICDNIRCTNLYDISRLIIQLSLKWEALQEQILNDELKKLVAELEDPHSELHVRATVIGLTSIALRNKEIVNILISNNCVQVLCVLCEKCESSTVRSLILRALSTICVNNTAIRKFENNSGINLISEIISNGSCPDPERSEAVALLAQITAPWIEDNRNVYGLQQQIQTLVKSLTNFVASTKCCQNLLLCIAALSNLTEMEPTTVKYILHQNSIGIILRSVKARGSLISVYVLEQVANLLANLSGKQIARGALIEEQAVAVLLHLLQYNHTDKDVEIRLQQKSIIALSRLSSCVEAADQIVKCKGIKALVALCRERKERHDSDAVLVAALATLRKTAEACGNGVIDSIDVQELVEPRLLDSFLAYSAQNESYV